MKDSGACKTIGVEPSMAVGCRTRWSFQWSRTVSSRNPGRPGVLNLIVTLDPEVRLRVNQRPLEQLREVLVEVIHRSKGCFAGLGDKMQRSRTPT